VVGDQPVEGRIDARAEAGTRSAQDLDRDDTRIGRNAGRRDDTPGGNDAGCVGAVAVVVLCAARPALLHASRWTATLVRRRVVVAKTLFGDDVVDEVGVVRVDPAIEHRDIHAGTRDVRGVG